MRALKIATGVMGVLIVAGTIVLVVTIARRSGPPQGPGPMPLDLAAVLDEPAGTHIAGIAAVADRLAVRLEGGGTDRVVLIDPRTGTVVGRVTMAR